MENVVVQINSYYFHAEKSYVIIYNDHFRRSMLIPKKDGWNWNRPAATVFSRRITGGLSPLGGRFYNQRSVEQHFAGGPRRGRVMLPLIAPLR